MMTGNHQLQQDGTISARGIDYGRGGVTLIFRVGDLAVMKNGGSMCWSGVGSPFDYSPTEWCLVLAKFPTEVSTNGPPWYKTKPKDYDGLEFPIIKVLERREPGQKWRACRDELIEKAKKTAKG